MATDRELYGPKRQRRMKGEIEVSTSTGLSFASQLGSLINSKSNDEPKHKSKPRKDDIFTAHQRVKRAKRDAAAQQPFGQVHTVSGEGVDRETWERSQRKMEDKARLYAAMKRGDLEDEDEKYAVDFDKKWAEDEEDLTDDENTEVVEYTDEFGRTRTGTKAEQARMARQHKSRTDLEGDRFTARPVAPSTVIYGDAIQHQAFDPDAPIKAQMEALAKKRDRSLTPPPDLHFDASREIRQKGTGFFQFSGEVEERKQQMDNLEQERLTTELKRKQREQRLREEVLERDREFQEDDEAARDKRRADEFLKGLDSEMQQCKTDDGLDAMQRIEAAMAKENPDG